jgi:hypothetical protein
MAHVTGPLVVTAQIGESVVTYTITSEDGTPLKVIRFSQLDAFHANLIKEVPGFRGRLPPKTMTRRTSADFVEARRKGIEEYLNLVASDDLTSNSNAWKSVFPSSGVADALPSSGVADTPVLDENEFGNSFDFAEGLDEPTPLPAREETEDAGFDFDGSFNVEMKALMMKRRDELKEAEKKKVELKQTLTSIEENFRTAEQEALGKSTLAIEAGKRLSSHKVNLQSLDAELTAKQSNAHDAELQQLELAKRLSERLSEVSEVTKKSQIRFETARRARVETNATVRSRIESVTAKKVEAEARNGAAIERHAAMSAVLLVLQARAKARQDEVKAVERDRDARRAVSLAAGAESSDAESLRRQAEAEANAAAAAVASHIGNAARRNRAHEVEIRRARECVGKASALRDMQSRGVVMGGGDRAAFEPAQNAAKIAADVLEKALQMAVQLRD